MIIGVLLVIAIYLLLNVAFVRVLGIERMAGDPFVAASAGKALFGPRGDLVIRLLVVVSILSAINACALMGPRVLLAMSRDGLLHPAFATVSPAGTPTVAHWATIGVVSGFILTGTFDTVLALCAFFYVVGYLLSFLSVFALRRKEPDTPRPFRVPGFPLTTGIVVIGSAAFLIGALMLDWGNSWKSLVLLGGERAGVLGGGTGARRDARPVTDQIKANFTAPLTVLRMAPSAALSAFSTAMMPSPSMVRSTTRVVF